MHPHKCRFDTKRSREITMILGPRVWMNVQMLLCTIAGNHATPFSLRLLLNQSCRFWPIILIAQSGRVGRKQNQQLAAGLTKNTSAWAQTDASQEEYNRISSHACQNHALSASILGTDARLEPDWRIRLVPGWQSIDNNPYSILINLFRDKKHVWPMTVVWLQHKLIRPSPLGAVVSMFLLKMLIVRSVCFACCILLSTYVLMCLFEHVDCPLVCERMFTKLCNCPLCFNVDCMV